MKTLLRSIFALLLTTVISINAFAADPIPAPKGIPGNYSIVGVAVGPILLTNESGLDCTFKVKKNGKVTATWIDISSETPTPYTVKGKITKVIEKNNKTTVKFNLKITDGVVGKGKIVLTKLPGGVKVYAVTGTVTATAFDVTGSFSGTRTPTI